MSRLPRAELRKDVFFFAASLVLTALAVIFAQSSWLWSSMLWLGASGMTASALDFVVPRKGTKMIPLLGMALCAGGLVVFGAWYFSPSREAVSSDATREREIARDTDQISPLIEVIRQQQEKLAVQEQARLLTTQILHQYEKLHQASVEFSARNGSSNRDDQFAAMRHTLDDLQLTLSTKVSLKSGPNGDILILQIGPNTFRVTFAVPMRVAPDLVFYDLPEGVVANIAEKTNIGFTVMFSPVATPIASFGFTASADL